ncbi:hypothetical protein [Streptomyces sp. NPDC002845]
MATATCTAFAGVVEGNGEHVGQRLLYQRVSVLASLCRELTRALVAARWDEGSLDVLAAGLDGRDEKLPSEGWMALRRLGWAGDAVLAEGVYVSDRVRRAAEEYSGAHPASGGAPTHHRGRDPHGLARRSPSAHRGGVGRAAGAAARRGE